MDVFLLGIPLTVGGANTECGDTALLWRKAGVNVTCVSFLRCPCGRDVKQPTPDNPWMERFESAGIPIVHAEPGKFREVPGLAGAICVSFCNGHTCHNWPELYQLGCRLVWSPAMTWTMPHEHNAFGTEYGGGPPAAIHLQSAFQAEQLQPRYEKVGCKRFVQIHGAFEPFPFVPRPRRKGEALVVGRLARACRTKWTPHLWTILDQVRQHGVDVEVLCQGWSDDLEIHCGVPPKWARCLPENTLTSQEFLAQCHILICPNWGIDENWPRVGLEAMSAGVIMLADARGGWLEMIDDRETGLLCHNPHEYVVCLEWMAWDERERWYILNEARRRLAELIDPDGIAGQWLNLFRSL